MEEAAPPCGGRGYFGRTTKPNSDFCAACGALLIIPDYGKFVECSSCGFRTAVDGPLIDSGARLAAGPDLADKVLMSSVKPRSFAPDACFGGQVQNKKDQLATVQETCPKCGYEEMAFYCLQLRSVDEGQTVFYSCLNCG